MEGADNIVAALEHHDRICQITLRNPPRSLLQMFTELMQESFPALTELEIGSEDQSTTLPLDLFSGAPHLRSICFQGIQFPALSKVLLSSHNLVNLHLLMIPDSGFISPKEMASCLSSLNSLEDFRIGFQTSEPFFAHEETRPPSLSRVDLPCLIHLIFRGHGDYLEDFVTRINTPLLRVFEMELDNIYLDDSALPKFINRIENFQVFDQAKMIFHTESVSVTFSQQRGGVEHTILKLEIGAEEPGDRFWYLDQALSPNSLPFSTPECLEVSVDPGCPLDDQDGYQSTHWLDLLGRFTAVKELRVCGEIALLIAPTLLEHHTEEAPELFPALQSLFIEEVFIEEIQALGRMRKAKMLTLFLAARDLASCPVDVHGWNRE